MQELQGRHSPLLQHHNIPHEKNYIQLIGHTVHATSVLQLLSTTNVLESPQKSRNQTALQALSDDSSEIK